MTSNWRRQKTQEKRTNERIRKMEEDDKRIRELESTPERIAVRRLEAIIYSETADEHLQELAKVVHWQITGELY